jgi:hypothetical protein
LLHATAFYSGRDLFGMALLQFLLKLRKRCIDYRLLIG